MEDKCFSVYFVTVTARRWVLFCNHTIGRFYITWRERWNNIGFNCRSQKKKNSHNKLIVGVFLYCEYSPKKGLLEIEIRLKKYGGNKKNKEKKKLYEYFVHPGGTHHLYNIFSNIGFWLDTNVFVILLWDHTHFAALLNKEKYDTLMKMMVIQTLYITVHVLCWLDTDHMIIWADAPPHNGDNANVRC